jgi:hypothetical protein
MAAPISQNPPAGRIEEYSYVKTAVLAVVNAVRSVFKRIAYYFSHLWPRRANIQQQPAVAPQAAPPVAVSPQLGYLPRPEDLLKLFSQLPPGEQDAISTALANEERKQNGSYFRSFANYIQGASVDHLIARGKLIVQANPYVLIHHLRAKEQI